MPAAPHSSGGQLCVVLYPRLQIEQCTVLLWGLDGAQPWGVVPCHTCLDPSSLCLNEV